MPEPLEWVASRHGGQLVDMPLGAVCHLCPRRSVYCRARGVHSCPTGARMVSPADQLTADEPDEPDDAQSHLIEQLVSAAEDMATQIARRRKL